jgi:hypothetical protein
MASSERSKTVFYQVLLCLAAFFCTSPVMVSPWQLKNGSLQPAPWQNAMGRMDTRQFVNCSSNLENSRFDLTCDQGGWSSPAGWTVQQADWTDLNHDGNPEITLLVKRPFAPWPVDRVLPHGGFINSHQDVDGFSSHIILIGWKGDHWGELWAGSALARPVRSFKACDVNNDSRQELMVLEGNYADRDPSTASSLAIWEWNSFGFYLVSRLERPVSQAVPVLSDENKSLILVQ